MYHLYIIVIQLQFSSLNYTISHVQASVPSSVNKIHLLMRIKTKMISTMSVSYENTNPAISFRQQKHRISHTKKHKFI